MTVHNFLVARACSASSTLRLAKQCWVEVQNDSNFPPRYSTKLALSSVEYGLACVLDTILSTLNHLSMSGSFSFTFNSLATARVLAIQEINHYLTLHVSSTNPVRSTARFQHCISIPARREKIVLPHPDGRPILEG